MSEVWLIVIGMTVGSLSGVLGIILALKWALNPEKLYNILLEIVDDRDMQAKLYQLAGVIGQGMAQGSGLIGMTSKGKPKLKDIALSMGLEYLKQFIPMGNAQISETQQPEAGLNSRKMDI